MSLSDPNLLFGPINRLSVTVQQLAALHYLLGVVLSIALNRDRLSFGTIVKEGAYLLRKFSRRLWKLRPAMGLTSRAALLCIAGFTAVALGGTSSANAIGSRQGERSTQSRAAGAPLLAIIALAQQRATATAPREK